jgi:hypothetical protein
MMTEKQRKRRSFIKNPSEKWHWQFLWGFKEFSHSIKFIIGLGEEFSKKIKILRFLF